MKSLLVSTHTPVLSSGRAVRTYGIARALAARGDGVDLLYQRFEGDEPDERFGAIEGCVMHEVLARRTPRRALRYARAIAEGVPRTLARGVTPELAGAAARLAAEEGRDLIVADGPIATAALSGLWRRRGVIYNSHNFESGFRHEPGMGETDSPERLRNFERGLLAGAAESWMVSHKDMASARELCRSARLRYMPNVVDVSSIVPVEPRPQAHRAVFVANFAYAPNQSALRFLLDEVMPRLWSQLPDARLSLAGGGLEGFDLSDSRIETHGFVRDLQSVYSQASCAVVPLLLGGGTPLKLVEALAYGLPLIATPRAVAGVDVVDGEHCLVADGGAAVADAIAKVMREGGSALARRGRELAAREYSIETLGQLLEPLPAGGPSPPGTTAGSDTQH
jgi:glycosyltransferase involved in cell wall biosynthesis